MVTGQLTICIPRKRSLFQFMYKVDCSGLHTLQTSKQQWNQTKQNIARCGITQGLSGQSLGGRITVHCLIKKIPTFLLVTQIWVIGFNNLCQEHLVESRQLKDGIISHLNKLVFQH